MSAFFFIPLIFTKNSFFSVFGLLSDLKCWNTVYMYVCVFVCVCVSVDVRVRAICPHSQWKHLFPSASGDRLCISLLFLALGFLCHTHTHTCTFHPHHSRSAGRLLWAPMSFLTRHALFYVQHLRSWIALCVCLKAMKKCLDLISNGRVTEGIMSSFCWHDIHSFF